jgi:hypothetical protein
MEAGGQPDTVSRRPLAVEVRVFEAIADLVVPMRRRHRHDQGECDMSESAIGGNQELTPSSPYRPQCIYCGFCKPCVRSYGSFRAVTDLCFGGSM